MYKRTVYVEIGDSNLNSLKFTYLEVLLSQSQKSRPQVLLNSRPDMEKLSLLLPRDKTYM